MKIIRFEDPAGNQHTGVWVSTDKAKRIEGDLFSSYQVTEDILPIARLRAPLKPSQIIGVGLNFRMHAEESGMAIPEYPVIFMKSLNAVQDPGGPILLPRQLASGEVDYECELAVIIGKEARNVSAENALDYVFGYTAANDVSARDWQLKWGGGQWCRGKMFDTFCPLGPCIATADSIPDPNNLKLRTILNGNVMQDWTTQDMIFDVPSLIAFLSGDTTLLPGTVILTGTPQGVGMGRKPQSWLQPGDTLTVEVEGIGSLVNPVARA